MGFSSSSPDMINIIYLTDRSHRQVRPNGLILRITTLGNTMKTKKKRQIDIPKEIPPLKQPPEIKPPAEPGLPPIPEEDPAMEPEKQSRVSPYDFPPPGEGFFPEIF